VAYRDLPDVELRQLIHDTLDDALLRLAVYDRQEDAELPPGALEAALAAGVVTVSELVSRVWAFLVELRDAGLESPAPRD